jgi:transcriptional regulator with XRE-family HTH domain
MTHPLDERRLRQLLARGVSQQEIARQLGIPRSILQGLLERLHAPEVYQVPPVLTAKGRPAINESTLPSQVESLAPGQVSPLTAEELSAAREDLWELIIWWRLRKQQVHRSTPRETQRYTSYVEKQWIERIKQEAEAESTTIAEIVNRAFRQYFARR